MQEDFNPYLEWLGRRDGQPPANYYELLGIRCYEGDPATILQAADAWIAHLRSIQPGPYAAQWQQILDQLNWAKVCLLDPRAKAGYDSALRGQQMAASPAQSAPPMVMGGAAEPPLDQAALAGIPYQRVPHRARRKSGKPQLIGWALTLLVLLSIAAFTALLLKARQKTEEANSMAQASVGATSETSETPGKGKPSPSKSNQTTTAKPAAGQQASTGRKPDAKSDRTPPKIPPADNMLEGLPDLATALAGGESGGKKSDSGGKTDSATEKVSTESSGSATNSSAGKQAKRPAAPPDPAKQEVMEQELSKAREAMAERKLPTARQHVKSALANAQTDEDQARCERAETLVHYLEEFWKRMREILTGLQPGDEVPIRDTVMIVVSADAKEITFRSEARNQTFEIDRLPNQIVMALVRERFAKKSAANVLLGAYLSVDPEGDPSMACQLWQEVSRDGIDMKDMITDLTAANSLLADGSKPEAPSDAAKLQQAEQTMKAKFLAELEAATSSAKKAELADVLLERSRRIKGNPELRFVMLREARDQAAGAGKAALACAAVDQLSRYFTIDDVALKVAAMEEAAKKVRGLQAYRETTEQVLKVAEQALAKGQADEAKRLVPIAITLAKKCSSVPLLRRVQVLSQQVGSSQGSGRKTKDE